MYFNITKVFYYEGIYLLYEWRCPYYLYEGIQTYVPMEHPYKISTMWLCTYVVHLAWYCNITSTNEDNRIVYMEASSFVRKGICKNISECKVSPSTVVFSFCPELGCSTPLSRVTIVSTLATCSVSGIRFEQHYRLLGSILLESMKVIFPASNEGRAMHGQRHIWQNRLNTTAGPFGNSS